MTRIFHRLFFVKMDSISGCDIRRVFTFPPKDNTLQYKNVYTSELTFLALVPWIGVNYVHKYCNLYVAVIGEIKYRKTKCKHEILAFSVENSDTSYYNNNHGKAKRI